MMNYFSKKKKWMACLILMAFVFSCIMPTNLATGNSVAWAGKETGTDVSFYDKYSPNKSKEITFKNTDILVSKKGNKNYIVWTKDELSAAEKESVVAAIRERSEFNQIKADTEDTKGNVRFVNGESYTDEDVTVKYAVGNVTITFRDKSTWSLILYGKLILKTEATVTKVWDDNNNQDGKRPASLKVTLSNGAEVTLNESNNWTATVTDLPKYANGQEIEYTWTETMPEGYMLKSSTTEGTVTTLTNTHIPELTEATVKKVWSDNNNQDGKRPVNLAVTLSNGAEVTLNEANNWTATVTDLPKYANGQEIEYTWTENTMPAGYSLTGTNKEGTVTTITNSYDPEKTSATVKKVWNDNDNQDGKRPTELKVTLSNGTKATLNEGNSWTATVTDLPKYVNGQEIKYTWTENKIPEGYALTNTSVNGTVTTLTNSYTPEKTSATVKKVWDDNNNQDGKRPASLTVTLSNGTEVTLNEGNGWTATVTDLPKYANGQEIKYTWTETMPEGYTQTNTSVNGTVTTLTNSYSPEKTSATVTKVWNDNNNQDGKRPASLKVTLSDGTEVTLNEGNSWTATVTDLPKYADGEEIEYTWTENTVPEGYTLTDTSVEGIVTTLTNSYVSEVKDVVVTKIWDDNNNPERPDSIEVVLYANSNEVTITPAVNKYENTWTYTWSDLPRYANGNAIVYTTDEVVVPEGYTKTVDGLTITNTHETVKVVTIKGSKVWNDNNNELKKRPESITVNLLCNGEEMKEATVTADTNWTYSFKNLPKADEKTGKVYVYTVTENEVPEYKSVVVKTAAGFDIYNTLITAKAGEVEVGKLVTGDKAPEDGVYKFVLNVNATRPVWTSLEVYQKQQLEKAYEAAKAVYDAAVAAWEKAIIAFKGNARVLNTTGSAIQFAVADKVTSPSCYEYLMISESGQLTSTTSSSYDFAGYDAGEADDSIVTPLATVIRELAASFSHANSAFFKALLGKTAAPLGFMRDDAQNLLDKANELAEAEALVTATDDAVKAFKPEGAKDAEFTLFINGEKYVTTSGTYQYAFELNGAKSMEDVKKLNFRFETTTGSVIKYSIDEVDWTKDGYKGTSILNGENKISGLTTGTYELGDKGYSFVFINEYEAKDQQQGGNTYTPPYTSSTNPPKGPEETFEDDEVPLGEAEVPEEPVILPGEELEDPEVPLGDAPRTGDSADAAPFMAMLLAAIAGLAATRRKFN